MTSTSIALTSVEYTIIDIYGYELHSDVIEVAVGATRYETEAIAREDFESYLFSGYDENEQYKARGVLATMADIRINGN